MREPAPSRLVRKFVAIGQEWPSQSPSPTQPYAAFKRILRAVEELQRKAPKSGEAVH